MQDSELKWQLELWTNENGFCPVGNFFEELEERKSLEYHRMIKKLNQFMKYSMLDLKKTRHLEKVKNEDFLELRISINIEIRLLGIIKEDGKFQILHVVHGFHKKDQKIRKSDLEIARQRIKEIT